MTVRRIFYDTVNGIEEKPVCVGIRGVAGEIFDSELYQPYGLAACPAGGGESILLEINGDPNNTVALPVRGYVVPIKGRTVIYQGDNTITITPAGVSIRVGSTEFNVGPNSITTNKSIITSGDVIAAGVSLRGHVHAGVSNGTSFTAGPS